MKRHFYQLDVFTDKPLAGNPLAVITDGDGLSPRKMQAIAREMNLAETVFVQKPTGNRALARLRIFTTKSELPLAGHPVIGTWFLLAQLGVVPAQEGSVHVLQQTGAGILPVEITFRAGRPVRVAMTQKPAEFRAARIDRGALARALALAPRDLDPSLPIELVSTGIFNLLVPVRRRAILRKIEPNPSALRRVLPDSATIAYCFAAENRALPLRAACSHGKSRKIQPPDRQPVRWAPILCTRDASSWPLRSRFTKASKCSVPAAYASRCWRSMENSCRA